MSVCLEVACPIRSEQTQPEEIAMRRALTVIVAAMALVMAMIAAPLSASPTYATMR